MEAAFNESSKSSLSSSPPALAGESPLGLIEKARVMAGCGAASLLLYTMGWMVARPVDPALPITFVRSGQSMAAAWLGLAVLTAVAGIVGTVISGRRLPQAGLFAAGIGLAVLSLHGGSMFNWMASEGAVTPAARAAFMKIVALDCALWAALMFVVWIATSLAYRWIWSNVSTASAVVSLSASSAESRRQPSIPTGGARPNGAKRDKVPAGWAALAVTTVIGVFVIWLTAGRNPVAPAQRGQTIAAVAAGLYFGAMIGRYFTGVQEARWYLLAVPAIGFLAALVSYFSADMSWAQGSLWQPYIHLATTPVHDLARPLPVEYIAVGTVAALIGFWSGDKAEQVALEVV